MKRFKANESHLRELRALPLVAGIERERWETLEPHIDFTDLEAGETLFTAGRESERLYLVVAGELGLDMPRLIDKTQPPVRIGTRRTGQTAGDFAVLNGGAHLVSASATEPTRVASLPRFAFELLTGVAPGILAHVYDTAAAQSRRVTLARAFIDLFGTLETDTLEGLLDASVVSHYHGGETLFREGDVPDGLHVVVSGRLLVETGSDTERRHIAEVQAPETVGELALLAGTLRSATVHAARESTVARLPRAAFDSLIAPKAELLMALSKLVVRRHIARPGAVDSHRPDSNFVVIPLDGRLPLRRFLHQLRRALRETSDPLILDARSFDTLYGKRGASTTTFDDPFSGAVAEWLDDKEVRSDAVIYVGEATLSAWTLRILNRADRVLLLASGDAGQDPARRSIERELAALFDARAHAPRIDLVLLHAPATIRPENTRRWLAPRRLDAFHHVRLDDRLHFERLARRLSGKARAIVFSGGGARGYAHLGVQRLIEEEKMPIDFIGGSSMGGLLGASFALDHDVATVERMSARFANKRALFDYTLPLTSLMSSGKLTRFCKEVYGDVRIEDLWTPFFCVSSNLADGRERVHDTGLLWEVVRTTISLPGVFSPVPTANGDLLIDGAVLNTFPVDVMHDRLGGTGSIIGVNVSEVPEKFDYYDFGTSLSGWRVLLSRINPFEPSIRNPRIAETLLRSTDIKGIGRLNETRAMIDMLIEPPVRDIALLDFKRYAEISELGYEEARRVFAKHGLCEAEDGLCAPSPSVRNEDKEQRNGRTDADASLIDTPSEHSGGR